MDDKFSTGIAFRVSSSSGVPLTALFFRNLVREGGTHKDQISMPLDGCFFCLQVLDNQPDAFHHIPEATWGSSLWSVWWAPLHFLRCSLEEVSHSRVVRFPNSPAQLLRQHKCAKGRGGAVGARQLQTLLRSHLPTHLKVLTLPFSRHHIFPFLSSLPLRSAATLECVQ